MLTGIHASAGIAVAAASGAESFGDEGTMMAYTQVSENNHGSGTVKQCGVAFSSAWDQASIGIKNDFGPNTSAQSTCSKPQYVTATVQPNRVTAGVRDSDDSGGVFTGVTRSVHTATNARSTK